MADEPIYPREGLPVFFADGIANFANSAEIIKFYLYRLDPSVNGVGPPEARTVTQVAMPLEGFFSMVAFLNKAVEDITKKYPGKAEAWDAAKAFQDQTFTLRPM